MKTEWMQLYESMQQDIACCKLKGPDLRAQVERCFQVCEQYCGIIAIEMEGHAFASVQEEIRFYKNIKPIFVSEIRYYRLLYHLVLFEPSEKPDQIKDFWLRELQRFDKFVRDNKEFCDYYKNSSQDRDAEWFTKPTAHDENTEIVQYDVLASDFLAMEKYAAYIKKLIRL